VHQSLQAEKAGLAILDGRKALLEAEIGTVRLLKSRPD
jgi:hypothetical protein